MTETGRMDTSEPATAAAPPSRARILIVDDRPENLLAFEASLNQPDYELVLARSGEEALKCVLDHEYAVILLDVLMPGLDGFETASLIRQRERSRHTPIIFVTAVDATADHVFRGYSVGAVDYIFKPISPVVLRSKVSVFVDLFRKTEALRTQSEELLRMRQREHELRLSELTTQRNRIFTLSLDMMGIVAADGRFVEVNEAWERALGRRQHEIVATPVVELSPPEDRPAVAEQWERLWADGGAAAFETRCLDADGRTLWLAWAVTAYLEERICYVVVRDVTSQKEAMSMLARHARDLARSNAELEQFAFVASHDLREPLRGVISYIQLLEKKYAGRLDAEADECIRFAVEGARRMQELIEGLLAFSRAGRSDQPAVIVDCNESLGIALRNLRRAVDESRATVHAATLPRVRGNPLQLVMLFQNLVENAIKYRRDLAPEIHVDACLDGADWRFSVRDNGIGIAPEYHDRIFRIFQRLHGRDQYAGTGIGLAIASRIVENVGGRIWVESEPGLGSTFHFTLPPAS